MSDIIADRLWAAKFAQNAELEKQLENFLISGSMLRDISISTECPAWMLKFDPAQPFVVRLPNMWIT